MFLVRTRRGRKSGWVVQACAPARTFWTWICISFQATRPVGGRPAPVNTQGSTTQSELEMFRCAVQRWPTACRSRPLRVKQREEDPKVALLAARADHVRPRDLPALRRGQGRVAQDCEQEMGTGDQPQSADTARRRASRRSIRGWKVRGPRSGRPPRSRPRAFRGPPRTGRGTGRRYTLRAAYRPGS